MNRSFTLRIASILGVLLIAGTAAAHDIWIGRGAYRDPVSNAWCCGKEDCGVIEDPLHAVHTLKRAYWIDGVVQRGMIATGNVNDGPVKRTRVKASIPYNRALPSPDGKYWMCLVYEDGQPIPRCFFAPPSGS